MDLSLVIKFHIADDRKVLAFLRAQMHNDTRQQLNIVNGELVKTG